MILSRSIVLLELIYGLCTQRFFRGRAGFLLATLAVGCMFCAQVSYGHDVSLASGQPGRAHSVLTEQKHLPGHHHEGDHDPADAVEPVTVTVIVVSLTVIGTVASIAAWLGGGEDPTAETYAYAYAGDWCCGASEEEEEEAYHPDVTAESTAGLVTCRHGAKAKAHVKAWWEDTGGETLTGKMEKGPVEASAPASCYGIAKASAELKGATTWEKEVDGPGGEPLHMRLSMSFEDFALIRADDPIFDVEETGTLRVFVEATTESASYTLFDGTVTNDGASVSTTGDFDDLDLERLPDGTVQFASPPGPLSIDFYAEEGEEITVSGLVAAEDFDSAGPPVCDEPTGACSLPDGDCQQRTEDTCTLSGGEYGGDGTTCLDWFESFDEYPQGPLAGQGGWEPWDGDPAAAEFIVTAEQFLSPPHSLAIGGSDDAVRQYSSLHPGVWAYSAHVFVPSWMNDQQYFILLNDYPADEPHDWSLQLEFDGATGLLRDYNSEATVPYLQDQWSQIAVEIDLDRDLQRVFYQGELLVEKPWTAGVAPGGAANIAAVNLFSAGSAVPVFYDDMVLLELEQTFCRADLDGSGDVGFGDLLMLLAAWGECSPPCLTDLDDSGDTGFGDLLILLSTWGLCP